MDTNENTITIEELFEDIELYSNIDTDLPSLKKYIVNSMNKYEDSSTPIEISDLKIMLENNNKVYFIETSSVSPKDAYNLALNELQKFEITFDNASGLFLQWEHPKDANITEMLEIMEDINLNDNADIMFGTKTALELRNNEVRITLLLIVGQAKRKDTLLDLMKNLSDRIITFYSNAKGNHQLS